VIDPAILLSVLVGLFWAAGYVLVRGSAGGRLPIVLVASILGAWAGDALAGRLGVELGSIGEYSLLGASMGSLAGVAIVALLALLGPTRGGAS
jgi:hypothetical protein